VSCVVSTLVLATGGKTDVVWYLDMAWFRVYSRLEARTTPTTTRNTPADNTTTPSLTSNVEFKYGSCIFALRALQDVYISAVSQLPVSIRTALQPQVSNTFTANTGAPGLYTRTTFSSMDSRFAQSTEPTRYIRRHV
jgi:hypothetical protein